jgi:hypothetical protein
MKGWARERVHGSDELVQMRLHAHVTDEGGQVLPGVRARNSLVIPERRDAGTGERLGEQPPAAVGAWQQRRTPVPVRRSAPGDEHYCREGAAVIWPNDGPLHGDAVQLPGHIERSCHAASSRPTGCRRSAAPVPAIGTRRGSNALRDMRKLLTLPAKR